MGNVYTKRLLLSNWKKYIPVIVLVIVECQLFRNHVLDYGQITQKSYELAVGDYMADFYKGVPPLIMRGDSEPFNIPALWSLYFIYFFAVVGQSFSQMWQSFEVQIALRCTSRKRWWVYQNYALWLETIGYLAVTYLTFFGYGMFTGTEMGAFHEEIQLEYNGLNLSGMQEIRFWIVIVIVPFIVMLTFAYLQYAVSIKGNSLFGMIVSVVILVASVFACYPLFLGNYLMLVRQKEVMAGGVSVEMGVGICGSVMIISAMAAKRMLDIKDLF